MYKSFVLIILCSLFSSGLSQDSLFTRLDGDTLTICHYQTERNCAALFSYDLQLAENLIVLTEVDTGDAAFCMCTFDLEARLTGLNAGEYQIDVWGNDLYCAPVFYGSLGVEIGGLGTTGSSDPECLTTRDDTSFVELSVLADTLKLFWNTPLLNCALIPQWHGWLSADTFHVTMVDTGQPADCICPFELEATFASFGSGTYVLDFWEGEYGYPEFSMTDLRDSPNLISSFQSECYNIMATHERQNSGPLSPTAIGPIQCYPNPFNADVVISYEIMETTQLDIDIFTIDGRLATRLSSSSIHAPGFHQTAWDGKNEQGQALSSGIYLVVFRTPEGLKVNRLVFLG